MEGKQAQALTVPAAGKARGNSGLRLGVRIRAFAARRAGARGVQHGPREICGKRSANCIVALEMSLRMRVSPLMVMQNLNVIRGKPSWSSVFLIGALNGSPHYTAIKFILSGEKGKDSRTCVATTTEKETGEVIEGPEVTIAMAKADGWWNRKDSKWPRMSELMLRYRAGAWLVRTVAPEMTMGFPATMRSWIPPLCPCLPT